MTTNPVDRAGIARRVVKVGGSLLELADLPQRLAAWLDSEPPAEVLLVVGGGRRAEAVRAAQRSDRFSDEQAHWLAIGAMLENARQLAQRMPSFAWLSSLEYLHRPPTPSVGLVDPLRFTREEEPRLAESLLPASWDVTSDSIAARLAVLAKADELVLLKSAAPPAECSLEQLAELAYVDRFFPQAAAGLRSVRFVDLRRDASR